LLGYDDCAQVFALRIPYPNSFRTGDIQISICVDLYSVGHTILWAARLLAEDFPVRERAVFRYVINANVALLTVVDLKMFAVR